MSLDFSGDACNVKEDSSNTNEECESVRRFNRRMQWYIHRRYETLALFGSFSLLKNGFEFKVLGKNGFKYAFRERKSCFPETRFHIAPQPFDLNPPPRVSTLADPNSHRAFRQRTNVEGLESL